MSRHTITGLVAAFACITSVTAPTAVNAHHSFALFDATKSVRLQGVVARFEWTNPHSWIFLNVPNSKNVAEEWIIELPAAGVLATEGWNKDFVKTGEKIIVRIKPLKTGQRGGLLEGFTAADEPFANK
jgi:hypothetical protein